MASSPDASISLIPFEAIKITLQGDYKNVEAAWAEGLKYIKASTFEEDQNIPPLEAYPTNPVFVPNLLNRL